jgi:DNA-binding response OmpR family regulator/predicted regulator of Ras-like GTPase activity (Roadblock/LC7/MglB family)
MGVKQPNLFQVVVMMSDVWRIFVVVGEDALNQNLVNSLHKDGYIVQGVTSGADAVRVLWTEEYDVVICDLKTPGADGFELLQWLRIYRPNTRMIMLGEADSTAMRTQALESGAVSYLMRPIDVRVLKEELRRLLQQTGFSASLDSFDLLDVIQIITMSRKSITLLVNTGLEERGILCFQNGELVWAEYGILRGEEAFFALAAHKNGTVTQQPWNEQIDSNVTQPLSRLIFQALQYRTKYADRQQYSGEIEQVSASTFSPFSEIDDSPFMILSEAESYAPATPDENMSAGNPTPGGIGQGEKRENAPGTPNGGQQWWESTEHPAHTYDDGFGGQGQIENEPSLAPTMAMDSDVLNTLLQQMNNNPASAQEFPVVPSQRTGLPSWLTDQPTNSRLPVMPKATDSNYTPATPATPDVPPSVPKEWLSPQFQMSTDQLSSFEQNNGFASTETQRTEMFQQFSGPLYEGYQNWPGARPAASNNNVHVTNEFEENPPILSTSTIRAQQAARRNYAALVNALQTLGYAVPGFIAAAIVTIEGQPIAQVTIDDADMLPVYRYISTIQKSVLQSFDQEQWGDYENTVVSSANRHLLMRVVGADKKVFQVLITARDANPTVCLEIMANVEGSISAALR